MDIQFVDLNSPLRIYYKSRNLTSGLNVRFNIWDEEGTPITIDSPAHGEVGTRGIYYIDINTPNRNSYVLVKASLDSGADVATSVYAVGGPSRKAFYVDSRQKTGLTVPYQIFDINAAREVENQNLTEVAGGFYYADVSEINSQEDLFFKVGHFVTQFDLRQLVIISGGIVANGTSIVAIGMLPEGGVLAGGISEVILSSTRGGKVVCGGEADVGTILIGGTAGGILLGGEATIGTTAITETVGGVVVDGEAGIADSSFNYEREKQYLYAIGTIVYLRYPSKDYLPSYYEQHKVEGIRIFGNHNLYDIGIGILVDEGLLVDDLSKQRIQSEEANYTIRYSGNQIDRLEDIPRLGDPTGGDLVETETLSDISTAEDQAIARAKKDKLSRLAPLADPIGGEMLASSTEEACCRLPNKIKNRLKKFQNMQALPDPVGGSMQFSETETRVSDLTSGIRNKLNRLQGTSTIPAPTGGIMAFTETDGEIGVETTSIRRKREQLDNVAMIPDPTGAYIMVSMDIGSGNEELNALKESAARKLKKLIGV